MATIGTIRRSGTEPETPATVLWTWTAWTTAGEALGFCVPAIVAAATVDLPAEVTVPSLVLAGAAEGAMLGGAQARVLRRVLRGLPVRRWVVATSLGAALAWLIGLLPSVLADRLASWPAPVLILAAAAGGSVLLLSIGTAQWTVLRSHVHNAGRWIAVTAGGWLAALAAFMLIAPPLWHEGQSVTTTVAIGVVAGLIMAATMAVVTGLGLERLLRTRHGKTLHQG